MRSGDLDFDAFTIGNDTIKHCCVFHAGVHFTNDCDAKGAASRDQMNPHK